jgi:hypothetical protein
MNNISSNQLVIPLHREEKVCQGSKLCYLRIYFGNPVVDRFITQFRGIKLAPPPPPPPFYSSSSLHPL